MLRSLLLVSLLTGTVASAHAIGVGEQGRIAGRGIGIDGTYEAGRSPDDLVAASRYARLQYLQSTQGQQLLKISVTISGAAGVTLDDVNREVAQLKPRVEEMRAKGSLRPIGYNTSVKVIENGKAYPCRLFELRPDAAPGQNRELTLCKVEVMDGPSKGAILFVPCSNLSDWQSIQPLDQVYLYHEGPDSTVFASPDPGSLALFFETLKVKKDHAAAEALLKSGKVLVLECNTRAEVIRDDTPIARIRILAGEHKGRECHVLFPFLKLRPKN